MTDEPNSIKRMKRYYGDRLHVEEMANLHSELLGGNDRSTIITLASHADAGLETLLALNLPGLRHASEKDIDLAFRPEGPLGTFSARIDLAYYLELIERDLRDQLHDLRNMRNAVAHTRRKVSLEDPELGAVARRLLSPKGKFKLLNSTTEGLRRSFISEAMLICASIALGRERAINEVRENFIKQARAAPF